MIPVTRRDRHHQPLTVLAMLMNSFSAGELAVWRKHLNGETLTRSEKRRLTMAKKRDLRNFITGIAIISAVVVPVMGFVIHAALN